MSLPGFARVVVDTRARALNRTFTYAIPPELAGSVVPGSTVEVPFGPRSLPGFVTELLTAPEQELEADRIRALVRLLDPEPVWGREILELAEWMRRFYGGTWQQNLQAAVPGPVLAHLRARATARRKGKLKHDTRVEGLGGASCGRPELNPGQEAALRVILEAVHEGRSVLLYGVTGSGKTEVYLRAVEDVLARDRSAIVMVPEVALTPQAVDRYRGRLGETVGVLHSGLSGATRRNEWWKLRDGSARVALGTRSAVFAPVERPALIILDEEHDHSYKQSQSPRYHARQVAARRARACGGGIVLGSATPSIETFYLARSGHYTLAELSARATGGHLPEVRMIDMRGRMRREATISGALGQAVRETVAAGEQAVLLLNRRGFSNYLQCHECGEVLRCSDCSISLTFHRARRELVCHYCDMRRAPPSTCPACQGTHLHFRGAGTERLESELAEVAPGVRVARLDRDTTTAAGSHARILKGFADGDYQVLVGTQMVAKGLDFPGVTLVGVLQSDSGLNMPDFRAGERTFQLITQVAGRAGRGTRPGRVLVQAMDPEHPCLVAASTHDYLGFYDQELALRRQSRYPPFCRLVRLLLSGEEEAAVQTFGATLGRRLEAALGREAVLGPAPCPISKLRGRFREHILLKGESIADLIVTARRAVYSHPPGEEVRLSLDPDPQELM